ncbi:hypothetical protein XF_0385 [Xylella fastidiosa 9a5c]|uniref:Uncharacterized protein n=1 Tax=Xylella fastidiosa (strain 9a5c) TaxID=160492 RepID=Q9PGB7_XYLFA|nr:hypothetical protein XF_0385 [Xylella fastidiosa 9a5c]
MQPQITACNRIARKRYLRVFPFDSKVYWCGFQPSGVFHWYSSSLVKRLAAPRNITLDWNRFKSHHRHRQHNTNKTPKRRSDLPPKRYTSFEFWKLLKMMLGRHFDEARIDKTHLYAITYLLK